MSAGDGGDRSGAAGMAGRHPAPDTRDELAPGVLMRALGVGVTDEAAAAGDRADPAPSAARAQLAGAVVIAGTALLAGVLVPGAGAGRNSAESGSNVLAAAGVAGSVESQGDSFVKTRKFGSDVVLGAAAAAAVSMSALAGDAVQWRVEDGGNGHWYRIDLIAEGITWTQSKSHAESVGGHLATISSASENTCLSALVGTSGPWFSRFGNATAFDGPWIGGFRETTQGPWQWVTGEPWGFTAWCSNQPSSDYCPNGETRLSIKRDAWCDSNFNWGDINETGYCPPFITTMGGMLIEWDADCNSDGMVDYGQILAGTIADANSNGIPDTCECATKPSLPTCCIGDIYHDGIVNGADLGIVLAEWGPVTPTTNSDLDHNGRVDGADLGLLLAHWGPCGG